MISGAEAHRIGKALESVVGWTREIIVVLNEDVHDGTEEIAVRHGARVFREPWKGYMAQKNSAADKATQPWLLGLDADEMVSPALRTEVEATFAHREDLERYVAYRFPRCTEYFGRWIRHGDWYPDYQTRLWQRGKAAWGGADPHERLILCGPTATLRGDLQHRSMESYEHQIRKSIAYADGFVRQCQAEGRRVTAVDLYGRPIWRFLRAYMFKLGFLDGWQGYSIAWMTAFYTFLRYAKARTAQSSTPPAP